MRKTIFQARLVKAIQDDDLIQATAASNDSRSSLDSSDTGSNDFDDDDPNSHFGLDCFLAITPFVDYLYRFSQHFFDH